MLCAGADSLAGDRLGLLNLSIPVSGMFAWRSCACHAPTSVLIHVHVGMPLECPCTTLLALCKPDLTES